MATMKAAVLGTGGMGGGVVSHLATNKQLSHVMAYDIIPERVNRFKDRPNVTGTTNLADVLEDPEVKVVFITASNDAHKDLTLASLKAGKAVMCEKPMATTLEDARAMVDMAEETKGFLQIGFELRYSHLYVQIKDWIDQGLLGDVLHCTGTYICSEFHGYGSWRNKVATGGGMFGEKLSHYVDLPRWWVGSDVPVESVHALCAPNVVPYYEVRDNYQTVYRFANGAVGHLTFMMALGAKFNGDPLQNVISQQIGDGHQLTFLVQGSKGAAAADVFGRSIKRWRFEIEPTNFASHWEENITWAAEEDEQYFHSIDLQTNDIVRRVAEGLPPMTPARDAYETMRLVFAAEKSADEKREVRMNELLA